MTTRPISKFRGLLMPVLLFLIAAVALIALTSIAHAQSSLAADPDATTLLGPLVTALGAGNYLLAALLAVGVLVWGAEHILPKYLPVLGKPIPSGLLALGMGMLVPVVNLAMGGKLTGTEVAGALLAAFIAWGGPAKLIGLFTGGDPPAALGKAGVEL